MTFLLDSFECEAYPPNAGDGQWSLGGPSVNPQRCIYIETTQMGGTSFGGDDPLIQSGTTTPDEIEINRGTRGRVRVAGGLEPAISAPTGCRRSRQSR